MEDNKRKLYIDWYLIIGIILMTSFGLLMVYSASFVQGYQTYNEATFFFDRHLLWIFIGMSAFIFFMFFPYRHFKRFIPLILLFCFTALILVMIPGINHTVNGATRWIAIGGFTIQPSEFVKLGMIIYVAYIYSRKQAYIHNFKSGLFPPLIIVGIIFLLIMTQPDLGTGTAIVLVAGFIAYFSGARYWHLLSLSVFAGAGLYYYANSEEYRMNRITGFWNAFELEQTEGFQLVQSYIAIAHGGITGAGFGQSVQKLFYLPEAHTDFILAIVSEELGLLGILFVLGCMGFIICRGFIIGARCKDTFGSLLAFGIVTQLSIQIIFNGGAVSGFLPITGIPFPFLSYGGSSLLITLASLGILANISRKTERDRQAHRSDQKEAHAPDESKIPLSRHV
ncbi:putative lipid II flippase FtsW [Alkalicoccus daliensis]|uniref:Probable peptidoglycan glycosyltransferase FtsW n=1 Tax=Alkalicoccus daliensis TaxID=745820 RepID=A0A1H0H1U5_9BACI|nr:putative lipid II flippase FtsW [Alkalicoccus daliensis]SDO13127.1 cell division-specific peptidoglycan biosynthesis regulator FtsW [Alkalicoccus daliensis]